MWEQSAAMGTGGNVNDSDSDGTIKPAPTQKEALQAALLLWKYVKDLNDPFAHRLEIMLGTFGQKTSSGNKGYETDLIFHPQSLIQMY